MSKRIIAALLATLLAVVGIVMLVNYTNNADERAFNDAQLVDVLQVKEPIPADTKASDIGSKVKLVQLPESAIAKGAISGLEEVSGFATTTELEPGEQVLLSRFAKGGSASKTVDKSAVPPGLQEVTVAVSAPQAVAATVKVGDVVGVLATLPDKDDELKSRTDFVLERVLITRIDKSGAEAVDKTGASLMVTFAVDANAAKAIVAARSHLWLTKQDSRTKLDKEFPIQLKDVLR